MINPFRFWQTGKDKPLIQDQTEIDRLYQRNRISIMLAITLGYGFAYACRLALSVVKKPLIDGGIFSADDLGVIGSAFFYTYSFGRLTIGFLIYQGTTIVNEVRHYDFSKPIIFWIDTSIISLILASTLWRVKVAD